MASINSGSARRRRRERNGWMARARMGSCDNFNMPKRHFTITLLALHCTEMSDQDLTKGLIGWSSEKEKENNSYGMVCAFCLLQTETVQAQEQVALGKHGAANEAHVALPPGVGFCLLATLVLLQTARSDGAFLLGGRWGWRCRGWGFCGGICIGIRASRGS